VLPVENVVDSAPTSVNSVTLVPPVAIDHNRPFASTAAPVPPPLTALLCEVPPSNTDVRLPPLFTTKIDCLRTVKRFVAVAVEYAPVFEGVNVAVSVYVPSASVEAAVTVTVTFDEFVAVYANVPVVVAVVASSTPALNAVPWYPENEFGYHVITGTGCTVNVPLVPVAAL